MLKVSFNDVELNHSRTLLYQRAVSMGHAGCLKCVGRIDGSEYTGSTHVNYGWAGYITKLGSRAREEGEGVSSPELPSSALEFIDRFEKLMHDHSPLYAN